MRSITVLLLILSGCSTVPYHPEKNPDRLLWRYGVDKPKSPYHFTTCSRPGCSEVSVIRFTRSEWQQVVDLFIPPSADAGEERQAIARAVGLMERLVGPKNGTFADEARNTLKVGYRSHQLACISESLNTTVSSSHCFGRNDCFAGIGSRIPGAGEVGIVITPPSWSRLTTVSSSRSTPGSAQTGRMQ